jgi:DNA polymerase-3 subunit epsilon
VDRPELSIDDDTPLAFVDVETTGCSPGRDRVIDVAVIGLRGGEVEFHWQSLVNPGAFVSPGITALTGIDNDMLVDAPSFGAIARELRSRLDGRLFVAHNARFDYGFIRREFARAGIEWEARQMCTVRLSRALYPEMPRHNLDAVMERHGLSTEARHRAMPDAQLLVDFWRKMRDAWPADDLRAAAASASQSPVKLPDSLPASLVDELPEEPGVYRFFGGQDSGAETLLYVSKANNLRDRVLDHFRGGTPGAKGARLAAEIRRVEWTETAGELGAQLLEAREIRESRPAYNRPGRGHGARYTWLFDALDAAPHLEELSIAWLRSGNAFGAYRSPAEARQALESMARAHHWCFKVLGFEDGPGSCVGYQFGRCKGACVAAEPRVLHLTRIKMGLMHVHLVPWPHAGAVVVREGHGERQQLHLLDAWQHLATVNAAECEVPLAELAESVRARRREFEYDDYRILTRLLRDSGLRAQPLPRHP